MPLNKVWLIGGTSESKAIAQILTFHSIPVIVSVTTVSAEKLYDPHPLLTVIVGKILLQDIFDFIISQKIKVIVDASHPHACQISQALIKVAQQYNYPYLRYERSRLKPVQSQGNLTYLPSISSFINSNYWQGKRVLLTIGSKNLDLFRDYQIQATIFARILPYPDSLNQAITAGFTSDRIIAIRPPLNYELEKALWQLWQIQIVVTKASGKQGGEDIKLKLAQELEIPLIIIQRPQLNYPLITEKIDFILIYCSQFF